jgi:hypothetical protein
MEQRWKQLLLKIWQINCLPSNYFSFTSFLYFFSILIVFHRGISASSSSVSDKQLYDDMIHHGPTPEVSSFTSSGGISSPADSSFSFSSPPFTPHDTSESVFDLDQPKGHDEYVSFSLREVLTIGELKQFFDDVQVDIHKKFSAAKWKAGDCINFRFVGKIIQQAQYWEKIKKEIARRLNISHVATTKIMLLMLVTLSSLSSLLSPLSSLLSLLSSLLSPPSFLS